MRKRSGLFLIVLGAVLIVSALLLFLRNEAEDSEAGSEASQRLDAVRSVISERQSEAQGASSLPSPSPSSAAVAATETVRELPVFEIFGYDTLGYLSFPSLSLDLPVLSDWDYDRLKVAPCRQFGSTLTDDLVIAGHNYDSHFGSLYTLELDDPVFFYDLDGEINHYRLVRLETLNPSSVEEVQNSPHDLVLYSCTLGGQTRVVAFFDRLEG